MVDGSSYPHWNGSVAVTADGETVAEVLNQYPASPDQEIAVTVSPAPGYALVEITGTYDNDYQNIDVEPLTITQDASDPNKWTFTMPDGWPHLKTTMRKLPVVTFHVEGHDDVSVSTDETGIVTPPRRPHEGRLPVRCLVSGGQWRSVGKRVQLQ